MGFVWVQNQNHLLFCMFGCVCTGSPLNDKYFFIVESISTLKYISFKSKYNLNMLFIHPHCTLYCLFFTIIFEHSTLCRCAAWGCRLFWLLERHCWPQTTTLLTLTKCRYLCHCCRFHRKSASTFEALESHRILKNIQFGYQCHQFLKYFMLK